MKAVICDICKEPISDPEIESFQLHRTGSKQQIDVCPICFCSPIILSEMRRTRAIKPKPKIGRPRGKRSDKIADKLIEANNEQSA